MKKLFVPFIIAKALKEKGFNEPCFGWYYNPRDKFELRGLGSRETLDSLNSKSLNHYISAPLYQQAIDWLREKGIGVYEVPQKFTENSPTWVIKLVGERELNYRFKINEALEKALTLI